MPEFWCIVTVRDEYQQRMPDVLVKLFHHFDLYDAASGYTNHRGEVTLYVPKGVYRIFAEKEGYRQENVIVTVIDKNNERFHIRMKRIPKSVEVKVHIREWIEGRHKDAMPYIFGAEVIITHKVNLSQQRKIAYTGIAVFECEEGAEYTVSALMKNYEEFYTPNPFKATQGLDFTYYLRKKAEIPPTPPPQKNVEITINVNELVDNRAGSFVLNAEVFLTDEETKITKKQLAPLGSTKFTCVENRKYTLSAKASGYEPIVPSYSITALEGLTHTYLMRKVVTAPPTPPPTIPPTPPPTIPPLPPTKAKVEITVRDLSKFPGMIIPGIISGAFDLISRIADARVEIYHQNSLIASANTNILGECSFTLDINKTYNIVAKKSWFEMVQPTSIILNVDTKTNVWLKPAIATITDRLGNSLRACNDTEKKDIEDFFGLPDKLDINSYLTNLLRKAKAHRLLDEWKRYWEERFGMHTLDKDIKLNFVRNKYNEFFNKLGTVETNETLPCRVKIELINTTHLIPVNIKYKIQANYGAETLFESQVFDIMLFYQIAYTNTIFVSLRAGVIPKNVQFLLLVYFEEVKVDKIIAQRTATITY